MQGAWHWIEHCRTQSTQQRRPPSWEACCPGYRVYSMESYCIHLPYISLISSVLFSYCPIWATFSFISWWIPNWIDLQLHAANFRHAIQSTRLPWLRRTVGLHCFVQYTKIHKHNFSIYRSTTHINAAYCYRRSSVISRSRSWATQKLLNRSKFEMPFRFLASLSGWVQGSMY